MIDFIQLLLFQAFFTADIRTWHSRKSTDESIAKENTCALLTMTSQNVCCENAYTSEMQPNEMGYCGSSTQLSQ